MCVIHLQLDLIYVHKELLIPEDKNLLTSHWTEWSLVLHNKRQHITAGPGAIPAMDPL